MSKNEQLIFEYNFENLSDDEDNVETEVRSAGEIMVIDQYNSSDEETNQPHPSTTIAFPLSIKATKKTLGTALIDKCCIGTGLIKKLFVPLFAYKPQAICK